MFNILKYVHLFTVFCFSVVTYVLVYPVYLLLIGMEFVADFILNSVKDKK